MGSTVSVLHGVLMRGIPPKPVSLGHAQSWIHSVTNSSQITSNSQALHGYMHLLIQRSQVGAALLKLLSSLKN